MSALVMGMVFKRYPFGGGELLLALALADHAHDDGTRIYPGIPLLMRKTRQSERSVQSQLRKMLKIGFLIKVEESCGGPGNYSEYKINPEWLNGAEIAPLETVQSEALTVQSATPNGAICDIPYKEEPSDNHNNHQTRVRATPEIVSRETDAGEVFWCQREKIFKGISEEQMRSWEKAYPKLDVDGELERIELWYELNPKKRKRQVLRFITAWLGRSFRAMTEPRKFSSSGARPQPGAGMGMRR